MIAKGVAAKVIKINYNGVLLSIIAIWSLELSNSRHISLYIQRCATHNTGTQIEFSKIVHDVT
jgi:hypothetical protein